MNTTGIQHTCVRHLYVRCPRAVSRPPHPQLPRTESGKLPSQFVPRGRDDRKGKDTPGRRDNTSVLRDKKRVRLCGLWGERGKVSIIMYQGV